MSNALFGFHCIQRKAWGSAKPHQSVSSPGPGRDSPRSQRRGGRGRRRGWDQEAEAASPYQAGGGPCSSPFSEGPSCVWHWSWTPGPCVTLLLSHSKLGAASPEQGQTQQTRTAGGGSRRSHDLSGCLSSSGSYSFPARKQPGLLSKPPWPQGRRGWPGVAAPACSPPGPRAPAASLKPPAASAGARRGQLGRPSGCT